MFKPNLNQQFSSFYNTLYKSSLIYIQMSLFGLIWNLIFHSLTLGVLVYWSFHSSASTFNQFWNENQLLLATLCQGGMVYFFRDHLSTIKNITPAEKKQFALSLVRGGLFTLLVVSGLVYSKAYDFLGFTSQAHLTFLSSYAWVFRTILLTAFVFFTELFIHRVLLPSIPLTQNPRFHSYLKQIITILTLMGVYAIWFDFSWQECLTLFLLFALFDQFWDTCGFLISFFVLTHAILSLPWLGNEFSGLAQVKGESLFFEAPMLQLALVVLLVIVNLRPITFKGERKS